MSFIGKIGVSTFYSQYAVFKTWWKTALILFIVQFVLLLFLQTFRAKVSVGFARLLALLLVVIGTIGTYLTYIDFTTTSHKMMKFSFHIGFYLFWITWFITCFYFLLSKGAKQTTDLPEEAS
jgi:cytochrome d ubiquinol oxidase, subunit II